MHSEKSFVCARLYREKIGFYLVFLLLFLLFVIFGKGENGWVCRFRYCEHHTHTHRVEFRQKQYMGTRIANTNESRGKFLVRGI